jgi:hypothetical protein
MLGWLGWVDSPFASWRSSCEFDVQKREEQGAVEKGQVIVRVLI